MDQAAPRRRVARDLLLPIESLPFGPLWLTLALTATYSVLFAAWCGLFGGLDEVLATDRWLDPTFPGRTAVVIGLLTSFLFVARRYEIRKAPGDWSAVQPLTRLSPAEFARWIGDARERPAAGQPLSDGLAALLGILMVALSRGDPGWILRAGSWNAFLVWSLAANVLLFVMMARAARANLLERRLNAAVAERIVDIDLLDTSALGGFARQGLRRAFYWAGGSSIASLLGLELENTGPLVAILAATLALAGLALLDPVRLASLRIRAAKRAELARVRERVQRARRELLTDGAPAREAALVLPGLLAYEARIESVREWPFDASTLLRFGALALLATGSWLGGALVERLLDVALE